MNVFIGKTSYAPIWIKRVTNVTSHSPRVGVCFYLQQNANIQYVYYPVADLETRANRWWFYYIVI